MAIGKRATLGLFVGLIAAVCAVEVSAEARSSAENSTTRVDTDPSVRLAQLELDSADSRKRTRRLLLEKGYNDIRFVRSTFKNIHAEACLQGVKYAVKVRRFSGKIRRGNKVGNCRRPLNANQVAVHLRKQGMDRISVSAAGRGEFSADVCEANRRLRLQIGPYGDVINRTDQGRCRRGPNIEEIKRQLREDGFNRINVVKKNQGRLVVEACLDNEHVRLSLGRRGHIRRNEIIGECARSIDRQHLARYIRNLGYKRVKVTDDRLPVYKADACKQNSRMRIRMNRYGEQISSTRLGDCVKPFNRRQIVKMLKQRGATRVRVVSQNNEGFRVAACYKLERRNYRIDLYGAILNREVTGRCAPPPKLDALLNDYRQRGVRRLRVIIEGCKKGRLLQFEVNRFGEEINRNTVGKC